MAKPTSGDIFEYPYLWKREADAGETEGRKMRPAAFVVVIPDKRGDTNLFITPITSQPPQSGTIAIAIPEIERRRAGLDNIPLWVVIDDYNHDILETSAYFDPSALVGAFSSKFHDLVVNRFAEVMRAGKTRRVVRFD